MNLPDLLRHRRDDVETFGEVETTEPRTLHGRQRAVRLGRGASVRVKRAHGMTALAGFPTDISWRVFGRWSDGGVRVRRVGAEGEDVLGSAAPNMTGAPALLGLDWPLRVGSTEFDLVIEQTGRKPALLSVGRLFDPRRKILPHARGLGVEVGPGLNPLVLPSPGVDVTYVEEKSPEEWRTLYARKKPGVRELPAEVVARTRKGSAHSLDNLADASLDFVFSNHVFEHLVNPLQVLRNWLSKLKPRGMVLGVVPDARFSFDRRQPISTVSEFRAESEAGGFKTTKQKYERWIRYTAPNAKLADLKARRYSIHVHYYTPEVFRLLAEELRAEGLLDSVFLDTAPNNKDFGFALTKAVKGAGDRP